MQETKWIELAHEKQGYLYPTALYWMSAQNASKRMGISDGVIACWYVNHEFSYLTTPGGLSNTGNIILRKLVTDKEFLGKIIRNNETKIAPMLTAAKKLSGSELDKVAGVELYKRWEDWLEKFLSMMTLSVMGTVLEMEEPMLTNIIERVLKERLREDSSKIGEYFQILTTSTERTVAAQEEIDLLML